MRKAILVIAFLCWNQISAQIGSGVIEWVGETKQNDSMDCRLMIKSKDQSSIQELLFNCIDIDTLFDGFYPEYLDKTGVVQSVFIKCISNNGSSWSVLYGGNDTIEILPREHRSPDLVFKPWEVFLLQCDSVQRTDPVRNPVVGYPSPDGPIIRSLDSLTNFKVYDVFELDGHWWLRIYQGKQGEHVFGYHEDYMIEFEGKTFQNPNTFFLGFIQWRNKEELLIIPKPNYTVEYY